MPQIEAYLDSDYIRSLCEICNEDNELLAFARLEKIEDEIYEFEVTGGANLRTAFFDTPVKINVLNRRRGFKVLAGNIRMAGKHVFRIFISGILAQEEHRGFVRVQTMERATIYDIPDDLTLQLILNNTITPWSGDTPSKHAQVLLTDISISGCRFCSDEKWNVHDRVVLHVLVRGIWISQAASIVRVDKRSDMYYYGCSFFNYEKVKNSDDLAKAIFGLQYDQRSRMK
ncbi:MAG: PilZ domain-containing protein [Clostridia bacterium]|nr:PilZ domain-containing protein [Clostridia bacterium]